jgi:hypothetical protein
MLTADILSQQPRLSRGAGTSVTLATNDLKLPHSFAFGLLPAALAQCIDDKNCCCCCRRHRHIFRAQFPSPLSSIVSGAKSHEKQNIYQVCSFLISLLDLFIGFTASLLLGSGERERERQQTKFQRMHSIT